MAKYNKYNYSQMIMIPVSLKGKEIYCKRLGTIEPVFGNIRFIKKLDRFSFKGKTKVNIQWMLYFMVHNIEKIMNYGFTS